MAAIVLATFNARWAHAAHGLRCLKANLGALADATELVELTLDDHPADAAEKILAHRPRLVGVGAYIWNVGPSVALLGLLERLAPEVVRVAGGPELRGEPLAHPLARHADYLVVGEAEQSFAALATRLLAGERPAERVIVSPPPRLEELDLPYALYGDGDLAARTVYLESSRGCVFDCDFCLSALDQGVRLVPPAPLRAALERLWARGLRRFRFVDRSFNLQGAASDALLDFFLSRPGEDWFVHLELAPTRLSPALQAALRRFPAGTLQLEVGVQSLDDEVVARVNRRQRAAEVCATLGWLRRETTAHLHTDLLIGLPGEGIAGLARSFDQLLSLAPHEIQLGVLKRLPGAPLARHDAAFGMVYDPAPPYEVLCTAALDFATVQRLKRLARFWQRLGNSGELRATLPLLVAGPSAFAALLELSDWLYDRLGGTCFVALERLYRLLADYLVDRRGLAPDAARATLASDWQRGQRRLPGWLRGEADPRPRREPARGATPPRQARHRR